MGLNVFIDRGWIKGPVVAKPNCVIQSRSACRLQYACELLSRCIVLNQKSQMIMKFLTFLIVLLVPVSGFAQSVQWDVSLWGKRRAFTENVEKLAELVAQKTNGDFLLNISYGGLSKPENNLDGISTGQFEMAQFCAGFHPNKTPAITVLELPYLGVRTLSEERRISQYLYRHPAVVSDFSRWNAALLMPSPVPQYNLVGTGPVPRTLQDLSGLSVRATGSIADAMAALKAVPNSLAANEVGSSLEAGDVEAVAFAPHAHMSFRTLTSARWWTTNLDPGTVNCPVVVNTGALSGLSSEHLNALYGSVNQALDHHVENYEYNMKNAWQPLLTLLEVERVSFNENRLKEFKKVAGHQAALTWIADMEQSGLPAVDLYRLVKIALSGINPEEYLENEDLTVPTKKPVRKPVSKAVVVDQNLQVKQRLEAVLSAYSFDKSKNNKIERIQ